MPGNGPTVKITNNGSGLVSPVPGYAETVSAFGREYALSTEDGDIVNKAYLAGFSNHDHHIRK